MPKDLGCVHWAKHKDLYGPISSISALGQDIIIVNDPEAAIELLEKRSGIYSDRPSLTFAGDLVGWKDVLGLARYGDLMRVQRKHFHHIIGTPKLVESFWPLQDIEAKRFVKRIMAEPNKLEHHARLEVGAIVLKTAYGYSPNSDGADPLVNLAEKGMSIFSLAVGTTWAVDTIPILRWVPGWFPGGEFQNIAKRWGKVYRDLVEVPVQFVKDRMAEGKAVPSLVSRILEEVTDPKELEIMKYSAVSVYGGGADTTVSALRSFFLAMTLHPEILKKAQEEIDRVVGPNRLPGFQDKEDLPYITALVKESLRWGTVVPMGLPHATIQDDVYRGYLIRKGSIVMANIWLFLHDPEIYPDPEAFIPERHLGSKPSIDPRMFCYGFGRRICPGKDMADMSLFITIAVVVATLNISKARDETGREITPIHTMSDGIISHPEDFPCKITPRSLKAKDLIFSAVEEERFTVNDAIYLDERVRKEYASA